MTARLVGAATAAVMLLALSACTDEPSDDPTAPSFAPAPSTSTPVESDAPSGSPSAATSVPPSVEALAPPALPAAATAETPEGAAAFAEWWFATLNYATATGDTTALRKSSDLVVCETCINLAERVEDAYSSGGGIEGGLAVATVEAPPSLDGGIATFIVRLEVEGAVETVDGVSTDLPPGSSVNAVAAVWRDRWVMGDLRQ